MKEVRIHSGIPCYEIEDYFEQVANLLYPGKYIGEKWEVEVKILEEQGFKSFRIPRTCLVFTGEEEAVNTAVHQYRRRFLRGGA